MKRLLIVLSLIALAANAFGDSSSVNVSDSKVGTTNGIRNCMNRIVTTPQGYVFLYPTLATQGSMMLLYNGSTWSQNTAFYTTALGTISYQQVGNFGDSIAYAVTGPSSSTERGRIFRFRGTTAYSSSSDSARILDGVTQNPGHISGAMNVFSNGKILAVSRRSDSVVAATAPAWGSDITWTYLDDMMPASCSSYAAYQFDAHMIPVLGGILGIGTNGLQSAQRGSGAIFVDTIDGFDTVCNPGAILYQGGVSGISFMYRSAWAVLYDNGADSAKLANIVQLSDSILYRDYWLVRTTTGRDTMLINQTITFATAAEMPTPTSSGTQAYLDGGNPWISKVRGTNKAILGFKVYPNVAVPDSAGIVYYLSEDNGVTWGDRTYCRAVDTTDMKGIVAPPYINENGGVITQYLAYTDSTGDAVTPSDEAWVFSFTIGSTTDPQHTITKIKTGHTIQILKDSITPINGTASNVKLLYGTSTATSTEAFSRSISSTVRYVTQDTLTGLTGNTKYYFRYVITDELVTDSSAIDSFTTLNTMTVTCDTVYVGVKSLGATTAWMQFTGTNIETYNGATRRAYVIFSATDNTPDTTGGDEIIDTLTSATNPDSTEMSGLSRSTQYYYRVYIFDSVLAAVSDVDSITTLYGVEQGRHVMDTNATSFWVRDTLKNAVGSVQYVLLYAASDTGAALIAAGNLVDSIVPDGTIDTVKALSLSSGVEYFFKTVAVDSQTTDTTALDSVTTIATVVDLSEVIDLLTNQNTKIDSILAGLLRGDYSTYSNIGAAVYGYQSTPSLDRLIRLSDSASLQGWVWDHDVSTYTGVTDSNKAGFAQNRDNMVDPAIDTFKHTYADSLRDKTSMSLTSAAYDSVTTPLAAAIAAIETGSSTTTATTSVNEILNPYFALGIMDTTTLAVGTNSLTGTFFPGWTGTMYVSGSGAASTIAVGPATNTEDSLLTGGRVLSFLMAQVHNSTQRDSFSIVSHPVKIFPGIYKFGIRYRTIGTSQANGYDSLFVEVIRVSSYVSQLKQVGVAATFSTLSGQYIATDTSTVNLRIRGFAQKTGVEQDKYLEISQAFLTPLGYNLYAIDTSVAVLPVTGMGRITVDGGTASEASLWTQAQVDSIVDRTLKARDSVNILLNTLRAGTLRPNVNVVAMNNDTSAARALSYIFDSSATGKGKMTVQQVVVGPSTDALTPAYVIYNNGVPAYQVIQLTGNTAISIEGTTSLSGPTASAAVALSVSGSGGSDDVDGTLVDSMIFTGDISFDLSGAGTNVLQKVYFRDTSGTDEYIYDVIVTARVPGASTNSAGPLVTNDSGLCNFTLPNGTFELLSRRAGYYFPTDTITVSGDGSFTIDGYNTSGSNQCVVWGYVDNLPKSGALAYVTISMPTKKVNSCDSTILISSSMDTITTADGYFEMSVPYSSCFGNEQYTLTVKPAASLFNPAVPSKSTTITVPDAQSYRVVF